MDLPSFIGNSTLPQWLTALFTGGGLFWFIIQWRGQSMSSEEQIRDHYAKEVKILRDRVDAKDEQFVRIERHWRTMLQEEERRHEECRQDREALRDRVTTLENELTGVKRQIADYSSDRLMVLEGATGGGTKPSDVAPHAAASAPRVKHITRKRRKDR